MGRKGLRRTDDNVGEKLLYKSYFGKKICFIIIGQKASSNLYRTKNETADLVTFTEEILNGKLHFLCSVISTGRFPFTESFLQNFVIPFLLP